MKPKIDYPNLKVGTILVKEVFIIAAVPVAGEGFYVCGSPDVPVLGRDEPGFTPCIGTSREQAEQWFKRSVQKAGECCEVKLVLIELLSGKVIKMHDCKHKDSQEIAE